MNDPEEMTRLAFRDARSSDADAVAELHARSWRSAYRGILSDDFLAGQVGEDRRAAWRARLTDPLPADQFVRLALDGAALVGFVCVFRDHDEARGSLLDNLHVDPARKGRGVGRRLVGDAASWVLAHARARRLHLWVYEANHAARGFYDRIGGTPVEHVVQRAPDGGDLAEICYLWEDLPALVGTVSTW